MQPQYLRIYSDYNNLENFQLLHFISGVKTLLEAPGFSVFSNRGNYFRV